MEVCEKQSDDAHHYRKRCSNLEVQLQEVQVVSEQWRMEAIEKVCKELIPVDYLGFTILLDTIRNAVFLVPCYHT